MKTKAKEIAKASENPKAEVPHNLESELRALQKPLVEGSKKAFLQKLKD